MRSCIVFLQTQKMWCQLESGEYLMIQTIPHHHSSVIFHKGLLPCNNCILSQGMYQSQALNLKVLQYIKEKENVK